MDETEFRNFLKQNKRKDSAIDQIVPLVQAFEAFYQEYYSHQTVDQITPESLESYVSWVESESGEAASKPLWALRYYFDFIENQELSDLAGELRAERVKRKPFKIANFRGVNPDYIAALEALYIENIDQMLDAARTPALRQKLGEQTGIPLEVIIEFVNLSDLARLRAVRSVRARLYHDAGLTTENLAAWEPTALHAMLAAWVEQNQFQGIAPQPKEVQHLVDHARRLPKLVVY